MNQNIDWHGFFLWAFIKDLDDIEETADLMMLMRNHYNNLSNSRETRKNK